jgi:6-phosphofructokinase 2
MSKIMTITMNPCIDTNVGIDKVVAERKLRCGAPRREPGGGGINVSRAIRKLGGESLAVYTTGGPFGRLLKKLVAEERVKGQDLPIQDWTRESFIIYENSSGQQYRFGMPGPVLQDEEWQSCLDFIADSSPAAQFIVASGGLPQGVPQDFYARLTTIAKKLDTKVILDASGEALLTAVKEGVFMIKPNLREFRALFDGRGELDPAESAGELVEKGQSEVVVISLGAGGAIMVTKQGCERLHAPPVPISSKVGAGDSMVAGIVLGLAQGRSVLDAVRFGVAAGTAAVITAGTELCRKEDTERVYQKMISGEA